MSDYVVVIRSPFVRDAQVACRLDGVGEPIDWQRYANAEIYVATVENSESGQDAIRYVADRFDLPPHILRAIPV